MGLTLQINSSDIKKSSERLRNIQLRSEDISGAGDGIRLLLQADVDRRFMASPGTETGGQVFGGEYWEPLSNAYLVSRPNRRGGQILRDTGELMQSMTAVGSPYGIWSITNNQLVFGTALFKAQPLQKKRPFLFWHPQLLQKVAEYLADYIGGDMNELYLDSSCNAIAQYLKLYLNQELSAIEPNSIAVRQAICYNNLPTDLSSFPILKVYRSQDKFSTTDSTSDVVVGYCLSFTEEEKIPGILRWIAVKLDSSLREWGINHRGCNPDIDPEQEFRAEYRIMSLQGEPIYSLLQLNFEIMEIKNDGEN